MNERCLQCGIEEKLFRGAAENINGTARSILLGEWVAMPPGSIEFWLCERCCAMGCTAEITEKVSKLVGADK